MLLRAVGGILVALVLGSLATSSASATGASPVVAFAYDSPVDDQPINYTAFERGPPTTSYDYTTTRDDADLSRGALERLDGDASRGNTSYDASALFVQAAQATGTTGGPAELHDGGPSLFQRAHVAAKSVDELPGLLSRAPKPLGLGSTGRTVPGSIQEQMAMTSVRNSPTGAPITRIKMSDPRWPAAGGWVKMQQIEGDVNIHYVYNTISGAFDDFKFAR